MTDLVVKVTSLMVTTFMREEVQAELARLVGER
jgi:hypothetical protein